jgi:hypothetical protein
MSLGATGQASRGMMVRREGFLGGKLGETGECSRNVGFEMRSSLASLRMSGVFSLEFYLWYFCC